MSDNVIDFEEARKRVQARTTLNTMDARDKTGKWCAHKHILVGRDFGVVECDDCKVALDAHTVLLGFANEERNFWFANRIAVDELDRLRKSVAELKAEEKRIKARLRRARKTVESSEVRIFARSMAEKLEGEP